MKEFDEVVLIMHRLRKQCPWDQEQSIQSLRPYLIEEAFECLEAMENYLQDETKVEFLIEELGDVLLQILFQAEILSERSKRPIISQVITTLRDKLVRRHPHIFNEANKKMSAEDVHRQWDKIKAEEKVANKSADAPSLLDGIEKGVSALQTAQKLGQRSKKIKFDWEEPSEVYKQLESELAEMLNATSPENLEEEVGDVLFCMVQYARHKNINAEVALAAANQKFQRRFRKMEELAGLDSATFQNLSIAEKEKLWENAKQFEKKL